MDDFVRAYVWTISKGGASEWEREGPFEIGTSDSEQLYFNCAVYDTKISGSAMVDISLDKVTEALVNIFSNVRFLCEIQCDQGTSVLTTMFLEKNGIKVTHRSVQHPKATRSREFIGF